MGNTFPDTVEYLSHVGSQVPDLAPYLIRKSL